MTKAELARKIIEKYPTWSKKALGKELHKLHPDQFKDSEHARLFIRDVTGASGTNRKSSRQTDKYIGPKLNPGRFNDFTPYVLGHKRIAILSDIHIPYHDREALMLALNWVKDFAPDCIVLNGDIIDCYQLSNFQKDPDERRFSEELEELQNFLSDLRDNFSCEIIYKMGNHEERYERWLWDKGKDVTGIKGANGEDLLSWETVTHASKYGHKIVTNKRIIKAGKLNIGHGHEFGKSIFSPVNPARGFYLRAKSSFIGGHYHQTSEHVERDLNGGITGCWSTGCLCDLNPAYMPINRWNLGFCAVEVDDTEFTVYNKKIINGKIV